MIDTAFIIYAYKLPMLLLLALSIYVNDALVSTYKNSMKNDEIKSKAEVHLENFFLIFL